MRTQWEIEHKFASRDAFWGAESLCLVGIGGASMSALALMLKERGFVVCGTDAAPSAVTAELAAEGIEVVIGHTGDIVRPGMALVLTDAIDLNASPEVEAAEKLGCPLLRRSQVLGALLKDHRCLCVTGTHGKTTTTGLLASALIGAGLDPLVVEGANIPEWGGPVREGKGEFAVVEACEAYNSLRDFDPFLVVLTNLECDHEDFYTGGYPQLVETMLAFVNRIPDEGVLVYCKDDAGARDIAQRAACRTVSYSLDAWQELAGREPSMAIPGRANRLNGAGALTAAQAVGCDLSDAAKGIESFRGAERRMQLIRAGDIQVYDDYAHHPSEIEASIEALRERPHKRLVIVFQPHLYSRTQAHLDGFARALSLADLVVLTDIYPAREHPIPGISSARIAEQVTVPCRYVPARQLLPLEVSRLVQPGDLVAGMGAGNIADFAPAFAAELDRSGPTKVAVLYGGDSAEREVSILTGNAAAAALQSKGYDVRKLDATELLLGKASVAPLVGASRPDVVFLAVHGTNAEDGAMQGLCELLHLPYTGSNVQASAVAMDKQLTKTVLAAQGVPVPQGALLLKGAVRPKLPSLPVVVKPNQQGSTVGLSFVREEAELEPAITKAFQYGREVLVEEMIEGMEISVPVLGDRALPAVEIVPNSGTYDFASKYTPGAAEEICPARLSEDVMTEAKRLALLSHQAVCASGATRTDMMVRPDGQIFVLEVNTLPGLTGTSLLPKSAAAEGIDFASLCAWLVEDAVRRHATQ